VAALELEGIQCCADQGWLGGLRVNFAGGSVAMNFSATQGLRLKHAFEPECGFRVRLLSLLLLSPSLVFRLHRIIIPPKSRLFLSDWNSSAGLYSSVFSAERSFLTLAGLEDLGKNCAPL